MLSRCDLIVLCLCRNPEFPEFKIHIPHIRRDSRTQRSEIVIIEFLTFGRHCSEKRAPCKDQIHSLQIFFSVNDKVFLLRSDRRRYMIGCFIPEQSEESQRLFTYCLHGSEKRRFLIQRFTGIGTESSRNAKCRSPLVMPYKRRGCAIPDRISSGFKCRTESAGRKRRCIRLSLYQFFARKAHEDLSARQWGSYERVMLLSCCTCKRLEPVRVMRRTFFYSPFLHFMSDDICRLQRQFRAFFYRLAQCTINLLWKPLLHYSIVKNIFPENLGNIRKSFAHSLLLQ